jgi:hypothetical protein
MAHDLSHLIAFLDAIGLADVQHTHDDLQSHLVGTHAMLVRWQMPAPVRRAGLFHSIYGTEGFPRASVPLSRRDEIRGLIGKPAEQLVYRYCAMSYSSLQQSVEAGRPMLHDRFTHAALPMSQEAFEDLLWVKLADACEQADEATFQRRFFLRVAEVLGPVGVQRWQEEAARLAGR